MPAVFRTVSGHGIPRTASAPLQYFGVVFKVTEDGEIDAVSGHHVRVEHPRWAAGGSGASCEYVDGGCPFVVREQATCHAGTDTAAENANVACEDPATNAAWAEQHMCENAGCCWNAGLSNKCFNPTGWGGQLGLDLTKGSSNLQGIGHRPVLVDGIAPLPDVFHPR